MDWEAPVDAWYVWFGAAAITAILAGSALALPSTPPPDANQAANAIDRVAGNELGGTASYEHDARMVRLGTEQISMRSDGGTSHATVSFGRLAPVNGSDRLKNVLSGAHPTDEYATWSEFYDDVQAAEDRALDPTWRIADGTLRVRVIAFPDGRPEFEDFEKAILVDA